MTPIIFFFRLVHLDDLLFDEYGDDIVKEVNVKETLKSSFLGSFIFLGRLLKSSIFVVQKAAAPKTGVEFCQGSIGTIRSSLAMSYDVWRRCMMSPTFDQSEAKKLSHTHTYTINILSVPALRAASAKKELLWDQKLLISLMIFHGKLYKLFAYHSM